MSGGQLAEQHGRGGDRAAGFHQDLQPQQQELHRRADLVVAHQHHALHQACCRIGKCQFARAWASAGRRRWFRDAPRSRARPPAAKERCRWRPPARRRTRGWRGRWPWRWWRSRRAARRRPRARSGHPAGRSPPSNSSAAVPCPAMIMGWSNGGTRVAPRLLQDPARDLLAVLGEAVVGDDAWPHTRGWLPSWSAAHPPASRWWPARPRAGPRWPRPARGCPRNRPPRRAPAPPSGERQNQVGGAADLERAAALQVLALEEHAHAGLGVETRRSHHRRAARQRPDAFRRRAHIVRLDCQVHGVESSQFRPGQ